MNDYFGEKLETFLDFECKDYGLIYDCDYDYENNRCKVTITRETDKDVILNFKYDAYMDEICIEFADDYKVITYFDWSVKYFWMLVAPVLFDDMDYKNIK